LTDSLFADAEHFEQPLLLAIDTYEQRTSEFDEWFRGEFLYGVAHTTNLRVLVGGQTLPEPAPEWSLITSINDLQGVTDAKAWMVWGEEQGIQIPALEYMAGLCAGLEGRPSKIVRILETLSKSKVVVGNPTETELQRLKRLRKTMGEAFGIEDLKNICADVGIEYEDFPSGKTSFIRELVAHLKRTKKIDPFIESCQEERPTHVW
jgi:hypothetical protein